MVGRRLAAILAMDVVGFSRLVREDEAGTLAALKAHREQLIQPKIIQHGGRVVKLIGDGLLAEFLSAVEAVHCAVEVQCSLSSQLLDEPPKHKEVSYRAGINIGDIVVDGDDIYGDGVNLASRLEGIADPGGICLAHNIFSQVKDKLDLTFEHLGEREVKNIAEPVTVYRVVLDDRAAALVTPIVTEPTIGFAGATPKHGVRFTWAVVTAAVSLLIAVSALAWWKPWSPELVPTAAETHRIPLTDKPSIAVLSFDTFSDEDEQRFLAEGLAEDIITQLARNNSIHVMARTSTFALRYQGLDAQEVGGRLGVGYVLEGSVRRFEENLRIVAQLIDVGTGNHVWAQRYDVGAAAIYAMQDEIVDKIVATLSSEIRETDKAAVLRRPPLGLDVYELTLRGLARKHRLNAKDMLTARDELLRAVELDPGYAPAWLYLGWVEALIGVFRWSDDPEFPDLEDAISKVEKSIELDPTLATAYQGLGLLKAFAGDMPGSLQAARRSVELGPGDADNLLFLGRALASNGEFDEAVSYARRALALNPVRPSYYDYHFGRVVWGQGDLEEADRSMNECLIKTPGFTACRVFQIATYQDWGEEAEASRAVENLLEQTPDFTVSDALRSVGFPGDEQSNERLAEQLTEAGLPVAKKEASVQ